MNLKRFFLTLLFFVLSVNGGAAQCGSCGGCCSDLAPEMQQFAGQLNLVHQRLFCAKFNDAQRKTAMQMVARPNPPGEAPTPDQAVQKVAQANHLLPRSGDTCPLK